MPENIVINDLTTNEGKAGLKDYLLRIAEDGEVIYTESTPNGSISARRGKIAIYKNGSTYEQWQNMDGGTTWQRIDFSATLDTDGTLAANSDTKVASQKATKTYADTKIIAPATNTADSVPQWNGANSKTLKDGLVVGTSANNLVQLNGSAQLPAVSGALLTNLPDIYSFSAGDYLLLGADTEQTSTNTAYEKKKEIIIGKAGTLRIKFDIKKAGGGNVYGRIYKNGVAVGTEQTTTSVTYVTYSQDISGLASGDLIQIYINNDGSGTAYVANFRLYVSLPVDAIVSIN